MRKLIYLIGSVALSAGIFACSEDHGNYGNPSVKPELVVLEVVSDETGEVFPVTIDTFVDSLFVSKVAVRDTTYDADGNQVVTVDSVSVPKLERTAYYYANDIVLPAAASTYTINIISNATWKAPAAIREAGANWLQNDGVTAGGGDGKLNYHTLGNTTKTMRPYPFTLNVYSSDSTVWYKIKFQQLGSE